MTDRFIQPDAQEAASKQADELFIHGLLGTLHDTESRGRRVDAAMQAIPGPLGRPTRPLSHRRFSRIAGAALLGAVVIAGMVLMALPVTNSAYATVNASIQAAKTDGTRRYEMRVAHLPSDTLPNKPTGVVDSDGPNQFLMRVYAPDGHVVVAGRDEKGEWAIRLDGGIEREHPRQAWPGFASVNGEAVFADSVDKVLEALETNYNLHTQGLVALPGKPGIMCQHIIADRKPGPARRQAQRVKLWIDPKTKELQRLEMSWPGAKVDSTEVNSGPSDDGMDQDARPEDRDPPDRRPDDRGPEGRPPMEEGQHPPDGQRPMDDGPRRSRPEGRPVDGPDGPPFGPGMGHPHGPPPQGRPGPRNGPPRRLPPLSRFVLERVDPPQFADDWFRPDGHRAEQVRSKD